MPVGQPVAAGRPDRHRPVVEVRPPRSRCPGGWPARDQVRVARSIRPGSARRGCRPGTPSPGCRRRPRPPPAAPTAAAPVGRAERDVYRRPRIRTRVAAPVTPAPDRRRRSSRVFTGPQASTSPVAAGGALPARSAGDHAAPALAVPLPERSRPGSARGRRARRCRRAAPRWTSRCRVPSTRSSPSSVCSASGRGGAGVVRHLVVVDEVAVDHRGAAAHLLGDQRHVEVAQQDVGDRAQQPRRRRTGGTRG